MAGVVVDGDGIQGLTASLLEAGARRVVATAAIRTVVVPLKAPRSSRLWWAGAAAVIAIAGAAGWRRRLASASG
jgi:hypothetical protein